MHETMTMRGGLTLPLLAALVQLAAAGCGARTAVQAGAPARKLYLDVHHFGPGKVSAREVAEAHRKDLAAQDRHQAKFLNYWFDEKSGTVQCLVEASSAEDAVAVHKEAHGLVPDSIEEAADAR